MLFRICTCTRSNISEEVLSEISHPLRVETYPCNCLQELPLSIPLKELGVSVIGVDARVPVTHVPLPVHPIPPHCNQFGKVPPVAGALDVVVLVAFVDVTRVVDDGLVLEDTGLEVVNK